jgi:Gram-negative bacterial TonB protein C-terminal
MSKMRLSVGVLVLISGLRVGTAQNPFEPESNIACVERVTMPAYPAIARQGRIEGTVVASVLLSPHASVEKITTDFTSKTSSVNGSLIRSVEEAIRAAAFRAPCANKTIVLIFDFKIADFKIAGQPSDSPGRSDSYGYPNRFWIISEPGKPR